MKRLFILYLLILFFNSAYTQTALQKFTNNAALKHASVGICVTDLVTGKDIIAHNADKSLTPASVMKLVTTATALEVLGENYRYKTVITLDAKDSARILIVGAGDPTIASEAFNDNSTAFFYNCTDALKKNLSANKPYTLYVMDNLFGYDGISPEWTWIDMGNYYAAGAYGISVFDNTYKLFFNTVDKNGCPKILRTEPRVNGLTFNNFLTLNISGKDNGYIYGMPFSHERVLRGDIPAGRKEFSIKGDIPDPGMTFGETLADYLNRAGFAISKIETARADYISQNCETSKIQPYQVGKTLYSHSSRSLKEIIREINVNSNNHYAEHLIRTLGRKINNNIYSNPLKEAVDFILRYWRQKEIESTSLQMHDGCGLAPQNAISPKMLNELLLYMYRKSSATGAFFDSLPKAGQEGTLRNFMKNTRYVGKISAKSGSIGGVQCYSGYLIDGNKKYAFTIMVNKFNGSRPQVRKAIEDFLNSL